MNNNENKTVFIVGASRGIGKALALEFANNGWDLFLTARNTDDLRLLKDEVLSKNMVQCEFHQLDITNDQDYTASLVEFKTYFNKLDLVILNSGISQSVKISNIDMDTFRSIFETNFFGIVNGLKHFTNYFKEQGYGKIAIVSSLADARGFPGSSAYAASKTAISHITEAARTELKPYNIDVVSVKPGFIITDMTANHKFYLPFLISSGKYARNFYRGIINGKMRIYYPYPTAFLTYLLKIIPGFMFDFIMRFWKGENADL